MIKSFKDLVVWQRSMELVQEVYALTRDLPKEETFGLTSQIRRSAISIPSNIAEGKKRSTKKDFLHFLTIADASAAELETQILIVEKIYGNINTLQAIGMLVEVQKMLSVLIKKLKSN